LARFTETALKRIAGVDAFPLPSIIPVKHPVVLMHGFGIIAGLRRGGHMSAAAAYLRKRGVRAYAPNVAPYNTIAVRSEMWLRRLEHVMEECRTDRVNLVAHSMGGLDARYMISRHGLGDHVASLVTISTPHHGSPVSEYILDSPDRLRKWLTEAANWMGTQFVDDGGADFQTALLELTPSNITTSFNPSTPDDERVRYWSYAGVAGRGCQHSVNPFLRLFNNYIFEREGLNDGMVSATSARWGEYLGTIPADHAQQIGTMPGASGFRYTEFFATIAELLADHDV
jgi:triacylglycerol lipase